MNKQTEPWGNEMWYCATDNVRGQSHQRCAGGSINCWTRKCLASWKEKMQQRRLSLPLKLSVSADGPVLVVPLFPLTDSASDLEHLLRASMPTGVTFVQISDSNTRSVKPNTTAPPAGWKINLIQVGTSVHISVLSFLRTLGPTTKQALAFSLNRWNWKI